MNFAISPSLVLQNNYRSAGKVMVCVRVSSSPELSVLIQYFSEKSLCHTKFLVLYIGKLCLSIPETKSVGKNNRRRFFVETLFGFVAEL